MIRRNRRAGGIRPLTRPVLAAALMALLLGSIVVAIGGIALGGQPSRLGLDLAATGAALVVVLGLSAWAGIKSRGRRLDVASEPGQGAADDAHNLHTPVLPADQPPALPASARPRTASMALPLRTRLRPAGWARVLGVHVPPGSGPR